MVLSPAFHATYSYNPASPWTSSHQMTLNAKRQGFTLDDFKSCAKTASMKRGRAEAIVAEVAAVVSRWRDLPTKLACSRRRATRSKAC